MAFGTCEKYNIPLFAFFYRLPVVGLEHVLKAILILRIAVASILHSAGRGRVVLDLFLQLDNRNGYWWGAF